MDTLLRHLPKTDRRWVRGLELGTVRSEDAVARELSSVVMEMDRQGQRLEGLLRVGRLTR